MAKSTMGTKLPRKLEQKMQIVGDPKSFDKTSFENHFNCGSVVCGAAVCKSYGNVQ